MRFGIKVYHFRLSDQRIISHKPVDDATLGGGFCWLPGEVSHLRVRTRKVSGGNDDTWHADGHSLRQARWTDRRKNERKDGQKFTDALIETKGFSNRRSILSAHAARSSIFNLNFKPPQMDIVDINPKPYSHNVKARNMPNVHSLGA